MTSTTIDATVEKLCVASVRDYTNPYNALIFDQTIDKQQWFTSPELISIYGTDAYERLSIEERQLLSFYEAVNFYSLNIHGEKPLVEGIANRMYRKDTIDITPFLHHFLDEENKHMLWFGGFCSKYAGKVYPDKKIVFPREYERGEEDFLFFAKVMIFEEIVDVYNVRMSLDSRLNPISKQINHLHHKDEARHLVFGRKMVLELFNKFSDKWSATTLAGVRSYLREYITATWKEYYNPLVYKDAGLSDPYGLHEMVYESEKQREHRKKVSAACVKFLMQNKMIEEEPVL